MQTPQAVQSAGLGEPSEQQCDSGLFSDRPHLYRIENRWLPDQQATVQTFRITETGSDQSQEFRSTTQAWPDPNLIELLTDAGFAKAAPRNDWPSSTDTLKLWLAGSG